VFMSNTFFEARVLYFCGFWFSKVYQVKCLLTFNCCIFQTPKALFLWVLIFSDIGQMCANIYGKINLQINI
jgi:hypothetical protein